MSTSMLARRPTGARLQRKRRMRRDAGMTLVELMFATGIAAVTLSMVFASLLAIARVGELNESRLAASAAVSSLMEDINSMPFEDLLEYTPPALEVPGMRYYVSVECLLPPSEGTAGEEGVSATQGTAQTIPFPVPESYTEELPDPLEVLVTLTWHDDAGHTYQVKGSTVRGHT